MYSYDRTAGYSYDRSRTADGDALPKDTVVTVEARKGPWPSDMFPRGAILIIKDGGSVGGTLTLKERGQTMGGPYEFKILSEKEGVYTLLSTGNFAARGIKVKVKG